MTTFNRSMITKMDKLCKSHPKTYKMTNEIILENKVCGKEYEFPKNLISIRQPSKKKELTEEQKKAASERMKRVNKRKTSE